jgi:hypothetical protein
VYDFGTHFFSDARTPRWRLDKDVLEEVKMSMKTVNNEGGNSRYLVHCLSNQLSFEKGEKIGYT